MLLVTYPIKTAHDSSRRAFSVRLAESVARLSLAGLPPFPGAWWRFGMFMALALPHERSVLTNLIEPHHGFVLFGGVYLLLSIFNTIAQVGKFGLIANPLALPDLSGRASTSRIAITQWSLTGLLLVLGFYSFSIGPMTMRLLMLR